VPKLADAEVNVCMYREFGRLLCEASTGPICRRRSACTRQPNSCANWASSSDLDPEPFIEREKHTTIKPLWDLWRSVTQDFFGTASFAVVANETYARRHAQFPGKRNGHALHVFCGAALPARRPTMRPCAI
jgi:chlorophyllide a reductase subunit Z